jgi:hypothetical protein
MINYNHEDVMDELWKQGIRVPLHTTLGYFIEGTIDQVISPDDDGEFHRIFTTAEFLAKTMIEDHMEQWEEQDGYSDELFNENYKKETA